MNWKKTISWAGGLSTFAGLTAYILRKPLIARWFDLPPPQYGVALHRNIRVPMPDGVTLATDHYAPRPTNGEANSFPTIVIRTPYGRALAPAFHARRFAERGYHVLVQDVRGRFGSGGQFEPFVHEQADGLATLSWLRQQPWYNDIVGSWGQSYLAYTQWALATAAPDALTTLFPSLPSSRGAYIGQVDDAQLLELPLRWMVILDVLRYAPGGQGPFAPWRPLWRLLPRNQDRLLRPVFNHLPLNECDVLAIGREVPHFQRLLDETAVPQLQETDLSGQLARLRQPIHLLGGWYDFMLGDMLRDYATLRAAGNAPYLTIGPWHHVHPEISGTTLREALDWYDAHLKQIPGRLARKPVKVYVMGAEEWRQFDRWPPPSQSTPFYLHDDFRLTLRRPVENGASRNYTFDPRDPTPAVGGPLFYSGAGARDNRILEARRDVLTYTTAPLENALEVIGPVKARLYVSSSLPHTDFFARLCDVHPDGRSVNLCDGIIRLYPGKVTADADGVLCIEVDMWATAHRFSRGHAIRLQISSGAHPRFAPNPGIEKLPKSQAELAPASQTVYHDSTHPSALLLPLL